MSSETDASTSEDVELVSKEEKIELGSATDLEDVFDIQSEVARGGMGIIYKGFHKRLQRVCAIKVLQPLDQQDLALKRFIKEARLICSFDHPNIVKIFVVGFDRSKHPFFAMEWLEGMTLDSYLAKTRRLKLSEFRDIFTQILNALSYAHSKNIIHRDIKPSNIFLTKDEQGRTQVKLLDFGIARSLDQTESASMKLTSTGSLLGTPRYMSPEQCNSQSADKRTDIYSISAVMYEAISGVHLFEGDNPLEIMYKQLKEKPDRSKLPKDKQLQDLNDCILRGLEKEPSARQNSIEELSEELQNACADLTDADLLTTDTSIEPEGNTKRITRVIAITLAALCTIGVVSFSFLTKKHRQQESSINRPLRPTQSKLPCHVYRSKAHEMILQYQIAKKRMKWDEAKKYRDQVEVLYKQGQEVGAKRIAELRALHKLTEKQTEELIGEQNEVHNVAQELAEFLFEQGRLEESLSSYIVAEKYAFTNFNLSTSSIYRQGTVLQYEQKYDQALEKLFKQAKLADEIIAKLKPPYTSEEGDIKPDREYWDRRSDLWQTIGDVYTSAQKPPDAAAAYKKALSAAEVNKRDDNTVSMLLAGLVANFEPDRWDSIYKEASNKTEFNSYRAAEVMRMYALSLRKTDKAKCLKLFEQALATIENTGDRSDITNADCLGRVINDYSYFEIENELQKVGRADFAKPLALAERGELFAQQHQSSSRLRGFTNYIRGVVAYLQEEYDKALNYFELVELDCLKDPFSVAHIAKLLQAETLLKKGMQAESEKQFLSIDVTRLPFSECIRVGPGYLTEALLHAVDAFNSAGKPELAKMIREKIEKSGRLKTKKD